MHDDDNAADQPAPASRVETAVGRGCFAASMVGFVLLVSLAAGRAGAHKRRPST
jgi:hypothetical protein